MQDTFLITIVLIVLCTMAGAFARGRSRDKCLRDFCGFPARLLKKDGKQVWGTLRVEHSGIELVYQAPYLDGEDAHVETSYILYKSEFDGMKALVRCPEEFDAALLARRQRDIERTLRPSWASRAGRKARNFFGTVRDSLLEVVNLFLGRLRTATPVGRILQGQDKYINQLQQQAGASLGTSYDPILERYIGRNVVIAVAVEDERTEYAGILKDYTSEFLEVLDISHRAGPENAPRKADMIVPRSIAVVRHAGAREQAGEAAA